MKKFLFSLLFVFLSMSVFPQYRQFSHPIWTIGTAKTIGKKEVHLNTLFYSQYGLTKRVEIQSKPLWWIKFPNLGAKINWIYKKPTPNAEFIKRKGIIVSTKHFGFYPNPLLKYVQNNNVHNIDFGISSFDNFFVIKNELLISLINRKNKGCTSKLSIYTLKFGNQKALNNSQNLILTDNSMLFRQTSMLGDYSLWYIGFDLDSKLTYGLNYCIDFDVYAVGLIVSNWVFEHKSIFYWYMGTNKRIRPSIGYQLSYASHPDAKMSFMPLFDLSYLLKISKKGKDNDLFEKGVLEDMYDDRSELY